MTVDFRFAEAGDVQDFDEFAREFRAYMAQRLKEAGV